MAIREADPQAASLQDGAEPVVNDFSIVVATANGTGSQTSNLTIMRAIFKMGIPVNGKNIFPSNIQGLPTWYHIRVSGEGYVARRANPEILVAFNEATAIEDIQKLPSGGVCIYRDDLRGLPDRKDVSMYPIPVKKLLRETGAKGQFRDRYTNMLYVGVVAWLLNIDLDKVDMALDIHFKRRRNLVDMNMDVIKLCYAWAAENLTKTDPYVVEAMDKTDGMILMTGNDAAGLGTVFGGLTVCTWYPITPSTSMIDAVNAYLPRLRVDEEQQKATYAVVQAEDELAAIGMVLGAGWAGARAMTSTSGPGISLMSEFVGLGYFAEIPGVIWDVQR
ncbi:MAG: 2-oxoacid:acceptor oxidoreductase family protein, partial [Chloroflexota bacterium]